MDRKRRLEGQAFAGAVADGFEQAVQRDELVLRSCPLAWVSLVTGRSSSSGPRFCVLAVAAATGFLRH